MSASDRIAELEQRVAELATRAETADANLALLIGLVAGATSGAPALDAKAILAAHASAGWTATIFERYSEGVETMRKARQAR